MIEAAVAKATAPLLERIAALEAELAKAKKNSSNSSKPPSSDLVKPPKPPRKDGQRRQRGGQPGHEQHLRADFTPEAIDKVVSYTLDCCPDCGGKLRPFQHPAEVLQQVEIVAAPTVVTEHRVPGYWCAHCQKIPQCRAAQGGRSGGPVRPASDEPPGDPDDGVRWSSSASRPGRDTGRRPATVGRSAAGA